MGKKAAARMMLILLLIGMFTAEFNISSLSVDVNVATSSNDRAVRQAADEQDQTFSTSRCEKSWDFERADRWENFAKVNSDSMEMIIGINYAEPNSFERLRRLITEKQGELVNTVSMNGEVIAAVVCVPITASSTFAEEVRANGLSKYVEPNLRFKASFVPNDPHWQQQWGPAKIEADHAWNTTMGDPSVLVAVIDTGVDWNHPDLAPNYVAMGYDWVNNDTDPMDDHGHGTHCAGIIAASLNNSIGIAGIAQVHVMAEKGLDDWGCGTEDDLANAIIHAVDQGAEIISCSWGSYLPSTLIHEAIKYAYERGVIVVAAAGNDNTRRRFYLAAYDEVIAVTATNQSDAPTEFTNFGPWVELAAPGVDVYSTFWDDSYASKSGTSMSAPHVTGVAALASSRFPNATRDWVRFWLRYTADDLGDLGFDTSYGYGRINARRAVEETPPDHDVLISSWETPAYVETEDRAVISTTVVNFGAENETNITVQLLVNGSIVNSTTIDSLATRKLVTVNCSWTPTIKGIYNVTTYLVPVYNETVIKNNGASRYVFVEIRTIRVPTIYPTIQEAVDAAGSGFTILVSAGTYYENVVVDKAVSLIGENRDTTIIDANGTGTVITMEASNVSIINFTIRNSGVLWLDSGISLYYSSNIAIQNNTMTLNNFGVYLWASSNCTFANNNLTGNAHYGFMLESAFNCTLSRNIVAYNFAGIELSSSSNNSLHENNVWQCPYGIVLSSCPNSTLYENNVTNGHWGIYLHGCPNSKLRNNTMVGEGWREAYNFDVWGWELSDFVLDIDTSNTVNGKPVHYWINKRNQTVPLDAGYVGLINSTNIAVRNLNMTNNGVGVLIAYTNNSEITNNTLINNEYAVQLSHSWQNSLYVNSLIENKAGISLDASSSNSLYENNITNVFRHWGILLNAYSDNNSVYRNNITNVFDDGIMIWYYSNNNSVVGNNIIDGDLYGIDVRHSCSNNLICANNVVNNRNGIRVDDSTNNIIYHNNFINSTRLQVEIDTSINAWDDGYPSGGNYWSDYTGADEYSGPNQDNPGSDRIGDTPYILDENNQDRYPLMKPFEAIHDVAVTNVATSKTVVGKGYNVSVEVTVENQGSFIEDFDITVYANTTTIDTTPVTIIGWGSTTVTFIWNNTGFAKGNYTISAYATPVPGEIDTDDNNFTDGWAVVTIPGDVDGNFYVEIYDIVKICVAYNSKIGDLQYKPNLDIDGDGDIDIFDVVIACVHYGQKEP